MQEATLYQFALCPFCNKVRAGLDLKGVAYKTIEVNPRTKVELPELPDGAPQKVPVLVVGDRAVYDSTEILKFLDEAYPQSPAFLPEAEDARKDAEDIEDWVDESFIKALPTVLYGTWRESANAARIIARNSRLSAVQRFGVMVVGPMIMHFVAKRILKKSGKDSSRAWISENLDEFEAWLGDQPYVCGDDITLADVGMFGAVTCVREFPIHEEIMRRPKVAQWYHRVESQKPATQTD